MKSIITYSINHFYFYFVFSFVVLISCTQEQQKIDDDTIIDVEIETTETTIPQENLNLFERTFIKNLLKVDKEMSNTWNNYTSLRNAPIIIITGENEGFVINPPSNYISESTMVHNKFNGFESLNIYRNQELLNLGMNLTQGTIFFQFTRYNDVQYFIYDIQGERFENFYSDYINRDGYFYEAIFFHELFHHYTLRENYEDFVGDYGDQNLFQYPLNTETLPLQLLLFEVMSDAYHLKNKEEQLKYLSFYVSIQNELLLLDKSKDNIIRSHGLYQEKIEGSARFVQVYSTLDALGNDTIEDPTQGWGDYAKTITTKVEMRQIYGFRIFYHTGAGAISLLKAMDYPNLEEAFFIPENTPYDLANSFLNLNKNELVFALSEAKKLYNWNDLVKRANYLLELP